MSSTISAPRGTKDVLPAESPKWQYVENTLRNLAYSYGFHEIRFPTFEHTELFLRGVGGTTDVVQKEMYTFEDRGNRSITLRPEGTASVVRSFIEHSQFAQGLPLKFFYIAPNFRYEKPQAGRLREHHQFGIECFGSKNPAADASVICVAANFLQHFKINTQLKINSIGCPNCRPKFHEALKAYFAQHEDRLCETCHERLGKNPMRILDCKSPICQEIASGAPHSVDFLCDECRDHFNELQKLLTLAGIKFEVDTSIVRGLDYYTKTVFEFVTDSLGAQSTVCGGGRYDGLVTELGGPDTPACGFGSGLERLIIAAEASGFEFPEMRTPDLYIASADSEGYLKAFKLAHELRALGVSVETDLLDRSLKAQLKHASRIGAKFYAVLGANEIESFTIKNMSDGTLTTSSFNTDEIKTIIKG